MGPPRSWSRESALPASPVTPRLRRRHSFSRSAGTSRYFRLYRSRNHLSHHEISSRWLHLKVPKPRAHPAAPRFLRHPFSSRLRRDAAGSRQTNVVASFPPPRYLVIFRLTRLSRTIAEISALKFPPLTLSQRGGSLRIICKRTTP